jgi:hypothetical protein
LNLKYVEPIEYSKKRIARYFGYKISKIDVDLVQAYIDSKNFKQLPKLWQEGGMFFYEYPNKPLIIIKDGQLYTTEEIWVGKDVSQGEIRHQASIVLRILNGAGLASYNRKAILRRKFTPYNWR